MFRDFMRTSTGWRIAGKRACFGLAALFVHMTTSVQAQLPAKYSAAGSVRSPFNLGAAAYFVASGNLITCGLHSFGKVCAGASPTAGGGFWPTGTLNQYIYNSGLQIAGINSSQAGVWTGDTVGAYFFDGRGSQEHGAPLTQIFNSLNQADLAAWPDAAVIRDTSLFNAALVGQKAISDQDTWVRYWDGDPNKLGGGRKHPMGIQVEQRSLAFNAPAGAENSIFFIYKFKNVTNSPEFQLPNEAKFGISLPDAGWRIDSLFAAFGMDPDVSANGANENFSTAILPFNMAIAYHATFQAADFTFAVRSDLYAPPFMAAPGFIGVKYLRSPINPATGQQVGLTLFTNNTNPGTAGGFPDPLGTEQLWRYLSNNVSTAKGDPPCNVPDPKAARLCALVQDPADTRFQMSSGPFSLKAGEEAIIVVAYSNGAAVKIPGYTPGTRVSPGTPLRTPGVGGTPLRDIERIAGVISVPSTALDANGQIIETKVVVQPRSVVANALVAQSIFNTKFLLPRPPEAPKFALVPGNNQVTIVFEPSLTEKIGDPFFKIAGDATNPLLFDPNYRQFDVEGYRIYRQAGLNGNTEKIAEFDKTGTCLKDFTGQFDPRFSPELGMTYEQFLAKLEEPEEFPKCVPLNGPVLQFAPGNRVVTNTGGVVVLRADTVRIGEDTGIPFAFIDRDVKNGITYTYSVSAFDVNSLASGSATLESTRQTQRVVPRSQPANQVVATFTSSIQGDNAVALDSAAAKPTIDPDKGTFSGPQPPTNGISTSFAPLVAQLLPAFKLTATIDSVLMSSHDTEGCPVGENAFEGCWKAYLTFDRNGVKTSSVAPGWTPAWENFEGVAAVDLPLGAGTVPADPTAAKQFGLPSGFTGFAAEVRGHFEQEIFASTSGEGFLRNRRLGACNAAPNAAACTTRMHGGARWFNGTTETIADPTTYIRVGHLTGIDTIWAPISHTPQSPTTTAIFGGSTCMQTFGYGMGFFTRAADIRFTWGTNTFSSVRDIVHNVNLRFSATPQAGTWGFLTADQDGNGVLDWTDFGYLPGLAKGSPQLGLCARSYTAKARLSQTLTLLPTSVSGGNEASAKPSSGQGFGLYVDGQIYLFIASAAPAGATVWTLRTYSGDVRTNPVAALDANGYTFAIHDRHPLIPGLKIVFESAAPTQLVGESDISNVHTVPDPYYVRSQYELGPTNKQLLFQNLPPQAIIRIFSVNGTLVRVLEHSDPLGGGQEGWDLRNRNNQFVATGVYFYVVETSDGKKKVGRFTVLQFAR